MTETTALVIGASMAGLLAARVLSDHFDRVLIIERDALPESPVERGGVPQGRHVHALLVQGQELLESFFPGLSAELTEYGFPRMVWCRDTCYFTPGGWIKRFDSGIVTNVISRPVLEFMVRQRVLSHPRVTLLSGREVRGLMTTPDKAHVTGVEAGVRGSDAIEQHAADLTVDASGRGSKAPDWLTALGYPAPAETAVNSYVGYATRLYQKPEREVDWRVLFINARSAENNLRGGAIFDIGGGMWQVSLGGLNRDYPPTDEAGFMAFARTLASSTLADALEDAVPLSPIVGYRIDGSRQRHYERLVRRPERFILMGDAVCAFNPIYGQGMTVAAMEAIDLDRLLRLSGTHDLTGLAARFQKQIAGTIRSAWLLATGEDLRFPGTEGDRPSLFGRLIQRYIDRYLQVSYADETLTRTFIQVSNLTASPISLLSPPILARVLRLSLRRGESSPAQRGDRLPPIE
ncbi:2-polyprenyl-6-methoxyphenol hydroxylase-like oxidoreductase [Anaerolineae bacterium CFX9]|nr:2-polyprenyl-6-methoxyphenol hydroxylase-like oxidoreductase [Anaerolineae bacterium CFX9]